MPTNNDAEKYRILVEQALEGIIVVRGPVPRIVFANQTMAEMSGYSINELLSLSPEGITGLIHPDDRKMFFGHFADRLAGKKVPSIYVFRAVRKNGIVIWLRISSRLISFDGLPAVQAVFTDITQQVAAEEKLKSDKERFQKFMDFSDHNCLIFDKNFNVVEINKVALKKFGANKEDMIGKNMKEILPGIEKTERYKKYLSVLETGEPYRGEEFFNHPRFGEVWTDVRFFKLNGDFGMITEDITGRKRSEEALMKNEEKFRAIFENSNSLICITDQKGKFLSVNPTVKDILGYESGELIGRDWRFFTHPDDLKKTEVVVKTARQVTKRATNFEVRYRCKDGSYKWLVWNAILMPQIGLAYAIAQDVTERRKMEEKLKDSEEKYRSLFEGSRDAMMTIAPPSWRFTSGNSSMLKMFKAKSEADFIACSPWELSPHKQPDGQDSKKKAMKMIDIAVRKGFNFFEWTHKRFDGTVFPAEVLLNRVGKNEKIFLQATVRDVTEHKRAEAELREKQVLLETQFKNSPDLIMVLGRNYKFLSLNRILFGSATIGELIGKNAINVLSPEARKLVKKKIDLCFSTGKSQDFEHQVGEGTWARARITPLKIGGIIDRVMITSTDITGRKQSERFMLFQRNLAQALSVTADFNRGLKICLDAAIDISTMDSGGIYLFNEKTGGLDLRYSSGLSKIFIKAVSNYGADHPSTKLVMKGKPIYVKYEKLRVPKDKSRRREGIKAIAIIPFLYKGQVIGSMNLASHKLEEVPESDRKFLELVSSQISGVISRMKAGEILEFEKLRLKEYFEKLPVAAYNISLDGTIKDCNQNALTFLGYKSEKDLLEKPLISTIYAPSSQKKAKNIFNRWKKKGHIENEELQVITKQGKILDILLNVEAIRDINGRILYSISTHLDVTEHLKIKNMLKAIFEAAADSITYLDKTGKYILVNEAGAEMIGRKVNEMIGRSFMDMKTISVRDIPGILKMFSETVIKGRLPYRRNFEMEIVKKDGSRIPVEMNSNLVKKDGKVEGIVLITRDISERKLAEEALLESEEKFRLLSDQSLMAIGLLQDGVFKYVNRAYEIMSGYSKKEILNWKPYEYVKVVHPDDRKFVAEQAKRKQEGMRNVMPHYEFRGITKKGKVVWFDLYSKSVTYNGKPADLFTFVDISNRKQWEEQRRLANMKNKALLESIGDGIVALDNEGRIIFSNPVFKKMAGFKDDKKLTGEIISDVFNIEDAKEKTILREARPFAIALAKKQGFLLSDHFFVNKKGRKFPASLLATPIVFDGKVIGAIETIRDITREKEIDRAKTEFVSLASHQLRTPLTSISWFTEMLLGKGYGELNNRQRQILSQVYTSNNKMISLVSSLLNVSRIELGTLGVNPVPSRMGNILDGALKDLAQFIKEKNINIVKKYGRIGRKKIMLDPRLAHAIFENLLSNSAKYVGKHGGIISITVSQDKNNIIVKITDNGCGIPKKAQPKVFEKFYRADNIVRKDPHGVGLGLYVVKSVLEKVGGKIRFRSKLGKGTTFYVTLPVSGMLKSEGTKGLE